MRFATGGQPVQADIEQFVKAIPNFVVNVPGFGDVDLRQVRKIEKLEYVERRKIFYVTKLREKLEL